MLKSILFFTALILSVLTYSQEAEIDNFKNEFGAHAGFTTGVGLSYRHWFNKIGVQLTAIPIKTDDSFFGSVGGSGLLSIKKTKYVRAYVYLGNHLVFQNDSYEEYDPNTEEYLTKDDFSREYNIGFGPGFSFGKIVAYNIQFGYGFYDVTDKFNMYPTIEMGLYYMF